MNPRRVPFTLPMFCGLVMSLAASPAPAAGTARGAGGSVDRLRTIGRLEKISIQTAHPYLPESVAGGWTRIVKDSGATYLRLHFKRFDLADGDRLEIGGADGAEPRVYTGRGPAGTGEFWAFTVAGDTAVLTLTALSGGRDGLEIDAYGRGVEPIFGSMGGAAAGGPSQYSSAGDHTVDLPIPEPDPAGLVCGGQDWRDVACYGYDYPVEVHDARAAVLAIEGCCSASTAFKVSDSGQFMTAYRQSVSDLELRLDYQNLDCGGDTASSPGVVRGSEVLRADPLLDYTLFSTVGDATAIPCLQLDRRQPALGERIFIPQHPWGAPKQLAIWSDLDIGGFCVVDPIPANLVQPTQEIGFLCDTAEGSLGAPVVSGATHRVVGINHVGRCPNMASRMDLIWPQISAVAGACSNGFACQPVSGDRCDCNGTCSSKETRYIQRGGMCSDCWEEPGP